MQDVISLVNSVGFPIVACVYMARRDEKTTKLLQDLSVTLRGIEKVLDIKKEEE